MPVENPYESLPEMVDADAPPKYISATVRVTLYGALSTALLGTTITVAQYDAPHHVYSLMLTFAFSLSAIQTLIASADFINIDDCRIEQGMMDRQALGNVQSSIQ